MTVDGIPCDVDSVTNTIIECTTNPKDSESNRDIFYRGSLGIIKKTFKLEPNPTLD